VVNAPYVIESGPAKSGRSEICKRGEDKMKTKTRVKAGAISLNLQVRKTMRNTLKTLVPAALLFGLTALAVPAQAQSAKDPVVTIKDQDNPARQPVHFNATVTFPAGSQSANVIAPFVVPANKRLVIELIAGEIFVPTGQLLRVKVGTTSNGILAPDFALNFSTKTPFSVSQDIYTATLPVRLYADPGTTIILQAARNSTTGSSGTAEISFSGYPVNLP
jgi:hypothetical protein